MLAWLDITSLWTSSEERGVKRVRPTEVKVGEGRIVAGVKEELMSYKVISCEGGGEGRGGEKNRGKQFPGVRGRGVDLTQ